MPSRRSRPPAPQSKGPPAPRGTVPLARALSKLGICSRAQAEEAIRGGRVRVNGRIVTNGTRRVVPETDAIVMDGTAATPPASRTYVMLNKPRGVLTTRSDPQDRATVYDHLTDPALPFLGPVGRLDQASEGLLLLTNDTQWGNAITAPTSHVRKTYHVQVSRVPDGALLDALRAGITTDEGDVLRAAQVDVLRAGERHGWLVVELEEGKNRQIRRMVEACGAEVLRLVRVAIGPLALGELAKGEWRHLTPAEVEAVARAAGRASATRPRRR
jgi:23S rRNA pseudouridine2605 synthase